MKKKTNLQTQWLERTTFDSAIVVETRPSVKTQIRPKSPGRAKQAVGRLAKARRPASLAELLDLREQLEIEAYQAEALRRGALGHSGTGTPDAHVVEEATAMLLRIAAALERLDAAIARSP